MNLVFKDMLFQGVVIHLDDILIYNFDKQELEHLDMLRKVLQWQREHKLFAQVAKCEFLQTSIEYLGHVVDASGIQVDPAKVEAVQQWPTPANVKDLQSFLGIASYYRGLLRVFCMWLHSCFTNKKHTYGEQNRRRLLGLCSMH